MRFVSIRVHSWYVLFLSLLIAGQMGLAAERNADEAAAAATGQAADEILPRPAKLVDLTKGEPLPPPPPKSGYAYFHMGPVGLVGVRNGLSYGDQIEVSAITPGSPAAGKFLRGDVIIGVQGKLLRHDQSLDRQIGEEIIKAEEEAGKGLFTVHIWRDRNFVARTGAKDVLGVDIDKMFKEAENDSDVYEWKDEEEKTVAVAQAGFDKYPVDGFKTNITVQLEVMGTYSDDSPWNCPVVKKVRDRAFKIIAERLKPDVRGKSKRGGNWPDVLALVASGEPEYVAIAKAWVHRLSSEGRNGICMDMDHKGSVYDVVYGGMQSWHHGFNYLEMAIYYEATGDKFILPEIRKRAICAALGQNGGGSWGHTFAFPHFNGGLLHRNNPGYGAMNNAGTRCFFLLALAKKAGIDHPEIDAAIARSRKFFGTYVDRGCIPYGYHSPYPSDDSNGKNYGAAYAFYTLGDKYAGKYFSLGSAHASFTRRGGHGSPTLWYYTPWSAMIAGPETYKATMRNMRYFYTMSRKHDGSFIFYGTQAPGIGGKGMRNPTATIAMHYSYPLKGLIITGKGADPKFYATDEEYNDLLMSARSQIKDPFLLATMGKPWQERGTDEVIDYLNHWHPSRRRGVAGELGKRYEAGEKDIVSKLIPLLSHKEPRMREGACWALGACGADSVLSNMSKVVALLKDEAEFVRMRAVTVIGGATDPGNKTRELAVLKCVVDDHPQMTADQGNVRFSAKNVFFPRRRRGDTGPTTLLATDPFGAGYTESLVRQAMERIVTADPQGTVPGGWNRDATVKLAGPITFAASVLQVNDSMFGGARKQQGQALLRKHGFYEAPAGDAHNVKKRSFLERGMRHRVTFKDAMITPKLVKQAPGLYRDFLPDLKLWLHDKPTYVCKEKTGKGMPPITTPLDQLIKIIELDADTKPWPSIVPDVRKMFDEKLAAAGSADAQLKLCRSELEDLERRNFFRKNVAMTVLAEKLGPKAIDDVSPFLGHEQLWLKDHAHKVAADLVKQGAGPRLIQLFNEAQAGEPGLLGNINAAGILDALAEGGHKPALETARVALKHSDAVTRGAAVQAVFKIGGDPELKTVFAFIRQAQDPIDFQGAEFALLSKKDDPAHVKRVSGASRTLLKGGSQPLRRSLAWVLGQFGGPENMAAIEAAIAKPVDDEDIKQLVFALAYSPDRSATDIMKRLVKDDIKARPHVASLCIHRMVGPNGMGDVSNKERVSFARAILNYKLDGRLITFLGKVPTGAAMDLLFTVMKSGGKLGKYGNSTQTACKAIVNSAEEMRKPTKADSELATEVLKQVVEYIEVTHLRGGVKAHVTSHRDAGPYMMWQDLQMRAGQALLRFHKPKSRTIPTFDDVDLDI